MQKYLETREEKSQNEAMGAIILGAYVGGFLVLLLGIFMIALIF